METSGGPSRYPLWFPAVLRLQSPHAAWTQTPDCRGAAKTCGAKPLSRPCPCRVSWCVPPCASRLRHAPPATPPTRPSRPLTWQLAAPGHQAKPSNEAPSCASSGPGSPLQGFSPWGNIPKSAGLPPCRAAFLIRSLIGSELRDFAPQAGCSSSCDLAAKGLSS